MTECADTCSPPGWKEADRLAALYGFEILDTGPESAFDSLARIAANVCNAPIAMIGFIDDRRQWFKSEVGLKIGEAPLDSSICFRAIRQPGVFVIPDIAKDSRFSSNSYVKNEPQLRFYASAPLEAEGGLPLGTLCVADFQPRPGGLTEQQSETLAALARAVVSQLELRQANKALAAGESKAWAIAETIPQMVWSARPDGFNDYYNKRWYEFTGISAGTADEDIWNDVIHPDDRDRAWASWQHSIRTGEAYEIQYRLRHRSGVYRWILARALPSYDERGRIERWYGTYTDIDERMQSEEALVASEERLRLALNAAHMVAWELNLETLYAKRSENAIGLLGIRSGPQADFIQNIHADDRPVLERFFQRLDQDGSDAVECRYILPCGRIRWLGTRAEKAGPNRIVGVTFDITDRKKTEEELWRSANHDSLTGLPNRTLFQRRLEEALAEAARKGTSVSLLLIDLDDFKDVNDTLGHDAGDSLLKETASRLSAMIRDCDTVARLGGDEFALLVVEPLKLDNAARLGSLVIETLRQPFTYDERTIISRASIGVATFPDHDAEPSELMKDADIALYHAKARGRHRVVTYSPTMRIATEQRVSLIRDMREAIAGERIVPFYQPRVCLLSGKIIGFEALARWQHPDDGLLTPEFFGSIFNDAELAASIGKLITDRMVSDMRQWLDQGLGFGRIALNLSPADFSLPRLAERILRILDRAGVPTEHFEIEVPETVLLGRSSDRVYPILKQLRQHGVRIALDDFGTGYASLTQLKQFPVDHVKIDRSFVRDLEKDAGDAAIITAIVGLGRSLNLCVTAEGVETLGQAQRLRDLGCSEAQGFLYAKPMPGSQVPDFLKGWDARLIKSSLSSARA